MLVQFNTGLHAGNGCCFGRDVQDRSDRKGYRFGTAYPEAFGHRFFFLTEQLECILACSQIIRDHDHVITVLSRSLIIAEYCRCQDLLADLYLDLFFFKDPDDLIRIISALIFKFQVVQKLGVCQRCLVQAEVWPCTIIEEHLDHRHSHAVFLEHFTFRVHFETGDLLTCFLRDENSTVVSVMVCRDLADRVSVMFPIPRMRIVRTVHRIIEDRVIGTCFQGCLFAAA